MANPSMDQSCGGWSGEIMEKNMKCLLSIVCLTFCLHLSQAQNARTCSSCNSTTTANCENSQGVALCTCKSGFIGDGLSCTRMAFCDSLKCCPDGYRWDVKTKQCVDIDECSNPALRKCSPSDNCVNRNGIHLCSFNKNAKCGGKEKCDDDEDCLTVNGVVQCADPCYNYNTLNGTKRLYTLSSSGRFENDRNSIGWFRFVGKGLSLREGCVGTLKCGSFQPYSLGDDHPGHGDGITVVPLFSNTVSLGCVRGAGIPVKACPEGYYVYKFSGLLRFDVYCTVPTTTTTTTTTTTPTTTTTTPTTTTTTPTTTTTTPTTTTTTTTTRPTTTRPPTPVKTQQPSTDAIEGSGVNHWFPTLAKVTFSNVKHPLPTTTTPSTTKTSPTTSAPPRTLSPPAVELLKILQRLQALAESMSTTIERPEKTWITNQVTQLTQQINDLDSNSISAALNSFKSELTRAAHNFLSSKFQ
ncbi:PREDICTED: uromodulin-like [Nanorana parkeri]|uniref:uromodulin-like n=1 Tax=Nanorana parkeri TaxID=125878 RepID=UPI0008549145|nr:PREDICTED: uromodulin-like [Nanorana parkeri]